MQPLWLLCLQPKNNQENIQARKEDKGGNHHLQCSLGQLQNKVCHDHFEWSGVSSLIKNLRH